MLSSRYTAAITRALAPVHRIRPECTRAERPPGGQMPFQVHNRYSDGFVVRPNGGAGRPHVMMVLWDVLADG
jgi:hypothetical protein